MSYFQVITTCKPLVLVIWDFDITRAPGRVIIKVSGHQYQFQPTLTFILPKLHLCHTDVNWGTFWMTISIAVENHAQFPSSTHMHEYFKTIASWSMTLYCLSRQRAHCWLIEGAQVDEPKDKTDTTVYSFIAQQAIVLKYSCMRVGDGNCGWFSNFLAKSHIHYARIPRFSQRNVA